MNEIWKKWLFCGVIPAIEITLILLIFQIALSDYVHPLYFLIAIWILGYLGFVWLNYWLVSRKALWKK